MNRPTRRERRALDRQIERLIARLECMPLPSSVDLDRHVGLLREGAPLTIATREAVRRTIGPMGFADVLDAIEQEPPGAHAGRLPVLMWTGDWISCQFLKVMPLAVGGDA